MSPINELTLAALLPGNATLSCASCGASDDLITDAEDDAVFFCVGCASSIASIPFPEYYLDLGGESD
jgi:hypothetical protein